MMDDENTIRPIEYSIRNPRSKFTKTHNTDRQYEQRNVTCKNTVRCEYKPSCFQKFLWYITSISNIMTYDINFYIGGVDIEMTVIDIILMSIATYMLLKSFTTYRRFHSFLWLILMIWSLYSCYYLSALQIKRSIYYSGNEIDLFMWTSYGLLLLNLGLRFQFWTKVLDVVIHREFVNIYRIWKDIVKYSNETLRTVRTVTCQNKDQ